MIGCGRMGRLHARVYSQMPRVKLVGVHDATAGRRRRGGRAVHCRGVPRLGRTAGRGAGGHDRGADRVPRRPSPSACLARGVACLIEKPLAKDAAEARQIVELARRAGVPVQVGHIERFNPAVRAMARLDIRPRFIEVTRISPLTFRSIDVGVVLDMMIHDIDIVLQLAGTPVATVDAVGVGVMGGPGDVGGHLQRPADVRERVRRQHDRQPAGAEDRAEAAGVQLRRVRVAGLPEAVRRSSPAGAATSTRSATPWTKIRAGEIDDLSELNFADLVQVEELADRRRRAAAGGAGSRSSTPPPTACPPPSPPRTA